MTLEEIHFFILWRAFLALYNKNFLFTLSQMVGMHSFLAKDSLPMPLICDWGRGWIGISRTDKSQIGISSLAFRVFSDVGSIKLEGLRTVHTSIMIRIIHMLEDCLIQVLDTL